MPARLLLVALTALAGLALPVRGQELVARHSFPLAGDELVMVVNGFAPGAAVGIDLDRERSTPPPSLERALVAAFGLPVGPEGRLSFGGWADAGGALVLRVPLTDPGDPNHAVALQFHDQAGRSVELALLVQPPTVLLPVSGGVARVELLGGHRLLPDVPLAAGLLGAALSPDGLSLHTLLEGGALGERSAYSWNGALLSERALDPSGERLARSLGGGPAFVIARAKGSPFAPPGRLVSLDSSREELQLDPLGQEVAGRRWAITSDGLTAFVAEDDLIVREIDLLSWRVRTPFSAGFNGDRAVADLALDEARLLVLSRRSGGQAGSLTTLAFGSGVARPWPLGIDPARLVVLDESLSLVVPAAGPLFQVVEHGMPTVVVPAGTSREALLDAAAVPGGALLLLADLDGGRRLVSWSPERGLEPLSTTAPVPDALRLVSAGHDLVLLVGASDGHVSRVVPSRGVLEAVEGLDVLPGAGHHLLP